MNAHFTSCLLTELGRLFRTCQSILHWHTNGSTESSRYSFHLVEATLAQAFCVQGNRHQIIKLSRTKIAIDSKRQQFAEKVSQSLISAVFIKAKQILSPLVIE
ncbi:Uncharacterised protein [Mycobacterium tuberculosis]|nr:Uncharacterised protein [Mycobacterium tuberculosis]